MAFTRCRRSSPALQSSYRHPKKCKSAGTVGGVRGRRRAARLFLGKACYVAPPPFRVLGGGPDHQCCRDDAARPCRAFKGNKAVSTTGRRGGDRAVEPTTNERLAGVSGVYQSCSLKKSSPCSPIPKPPVGGGRMPACLWPLVFEIGDRRYRGSDSGAAQRHGRYRRVPREERAQNGLCGAGRDRRPVLCSGVKANRMGLALRPHLSPKPGYQCNRGTLNYVLCVWLCYLE